MGNILFLILAFVIAQGDVAALKLQTPQQVVLQEILSGTTNSRSRL